MEPWTTLLLAPGTFLSDVLVFVGLPPGPRRGLHVFALLLIVSSALLFLLAPQPWRPIYYALVMFHVFIELPLIFLYAGRPGAPG